MQNSIGGYLGLELKDGNEFHPEAVALNSGRNALEYILKHNMFSKIYIPFYTCDAILKPINNLNISYEFYSINQQLEPIFDFDKLASNDAFLYTNYYGLKSDFIESTYQKQKNIIIDNAQAFYAKPIKYLNTFYSPRKFFGIPDGGYAYPMSNSRIDLDTAPSFEQMSHLLKQLEVSTEFGFDDYQDNENRIEKLSLKLMSNLTKKILKSIDYKDVSDKRIQNFNFLVKELKDFNLLSIKSVKEAPLSYPLLLTRDVDEIRKKLIKQKIYTPNYWQNVLSWLPNKECFETKLVKNTIHLPIDQRYSLSDMSYMVRSVRILLKENE